MAFEIKIEIKGTEASASLLDVISGKEVARSAWKDERNLSSEFFKRMNIILRKAKITLRDVEKVSFDCDSPYFGKKQKWEDMQMEKIDSTGKCGFTTWQTGGIIAETMNFALKG